MNNGRLWCVVSPTVGIPLFLGAVALTSLTVHNAVLSNSQWYKDFYSGSSARKVATETSAPAVAATSQVTPSDFTINVTPAAGSTANGAAAFTVTVTPKTPAAAKAELTVATTATK
jgi:light-harvesting protein B-800-850 alpha chain